MPDSPFVGPSYSLASRPTSVQRTVNLMPVPIEPGNERAGWVFKDVPGLVSITTHGPPPPHICTGGPTWSARTSISDRFAGLAFGQGRFVATGHGQAGSAPTKTMYSLDKGQTWIAGGTIPNVGNGTPNFLRFGNDIFLCVISGAATPVTTDGGVTWSNLGGSGITSPVSMWFGDDIFVVVNGIGANVKSTIDGSGWTSHTTPAILSQCFWDAPRNRWLGLESGGLRCWTSPDLTTWTQRGNMPFAALPVTANNIAQATFGEHIGTIVCAYNDGTTSTSYTDDGGDTWGSSALLVTNQLVNVIFGNGVFITSKALGGQTNISSDGGRTWIAGNDLTEFKTWILAYNGENSYTAVGDDGANDTVANVGEC